METNDDPSFNDGAYRYSDIVDIRYCKNIISNECYLLIRMRQGFGVSVPPFYFGKFINGMPDDLKPLLQHNLPSSLSAYYKL
jgi:hypothetical protein